MPGLSTEYDVIVIGGGVSGLACAAYLQRSGLKVAVFERREEVGTHCATEELMAPGVRMNLHATFIVAHMGVASEDLELGRFGFEPVTSSEWATMHTFRDGSAFLQHISDARKQYEAWKRLSLKDAEQYRRIINYLGPLWPEYIHLALATRPNPEALARLGQINNGIPGLPSDWRHLNGFQVADALFEDDRIKTALNTMSIELGVYPWDRGIGATTTVLGLAMSFGRWHARGGSHALPHALARCFVHYGGMLFQGCPVAKIDVQGGQAKGVFLSKNAVYPEAEVRATRAVISDLSARPTFLELVGADKLPLRVAQYIRDYIYDGQILFTNYWALSEAPQWTSAREFPEVSRAFGFNFGVESTDDLRRLMVDKTSDRLPDPPIPAGGSCQGYVMADPTQAPPGQHTLMTWCCVPYHLKSLGGAEKWDEVREEYGDKVEDLLAEYMPNLKRAKLTRYIMTPLDVYRRNPSAVYGDIIGGTVTPMQFWDMRPFPGCGAPRTPIERLYISNSIWPIGTTTLPGSVTAETVAEDLGISKPDWWRHKALDAYSRMCAKYGFDWHPTVD